MSNPLRRFARSTDAAAANAYGLLVALLCFVYLVSVMTDGPAWVGVVLVMELATVWLAFAASESKTARRIVAVACLILAVLSLTSVGFSYALVEDTWITQVLAVASAVVYLIAPLVILRHLVQRARVDKQTLFGAIAVYLMLGMMFAFTYRAISLIQIDPPFFGAAGPGTSANFLFFSFITLTTTGYGNLVPATNPGQTVAVAEAIIGQLFLVTALAKIVNAWRIPGMSASGQSGTPK